ncbi:sigma-54-dependent transcriptional regulator [Erythrobacter sp. EC-HK427]|uniref:sigma-54-dependent transcriptional regulator n=1 Tax=Erythrobacter sp. EC-HK427 TaxID=2038396 RepID=UPI001251101C|nr:sigma-54 dependent transcriptional regulator [Erythrobacter sp. EC-HK427]VVT00382.1 conserved hypothetical protein [Erythrobacter sp. EC-HK427]
MTAAPTIKVVVVEDDPALGEALAQALRLEGMDVALYSDARIVMRSIGPSFDGVIVSDVRLPGIDGIEFFELVRKQDPDIPVIFTTGHGDVAMAVDMLKNGAADFFTKPYSISEILRAIQTAAEKRNLVLENRRLRSALSNRGKVGVIGTSQAAETLRNVLTAVAEADIDAVLVGETGTGKTYAARLLHDLSPRASRPFITIDPGLVAHRDAELVLFGREPGTGLSRTGLIERANGGTLFLDDVGAMEGAIRSRLLSTLETRTLLPLGAERERKLDFRVIVAARESSAAGDSMLTPSFESRLGAVRISLPPLSERRDDIADFFRRFVADLEVSTNKTAEPIGAAEWRHMQTHDWPGNLHELRGYAHAFILGISATGTVANAGAGIGSLQTVVADFEKSVLEEALRMSDGNVSIVADRMQIPRKTLYDKLSRYELRPRDFRRDLPS